VMRRLLFIIGSGAVGGRELQLLELATRLRGAGGDAGVVFLERGGPVADRLAERGVSTWEPPRWVWRRFGPFWFPLRVSGGALALIVALRRHRPDIVHAMLFTSVWFGLPLARLVHPSAQSVAGVYGFTELKPSLFRHLYGRALRRADLVVANAEHLNSDNSAEFEVDPERMTVIPNGVRIPPAASRCDTAPAVSVTVANFHPYKGYRDLVTAISRLDATLQVNFRLCGTGQDRGSIQAMVDRLSLRERVTFVVPPADVEDELANAQFAIHPSHTEGLSNAILEQLASGLPVIAYDVGGNSQLIQHRHNGLLVPVGDIDGLTVAIDELARNPELRTQLGRNARASAAAFSWDRCVDAHIAVYESLLRTDDVTGARHRRT